MIKRIEDIHPAPHQTVRLKKAGSRYEVRYLQREVEAPTTKISRDEYVLNKTGEVLPYTHTERRIDNLGNMTATMERLRDLLLTNIVPNKSLWCCLTYKGTPTEKQAYEDFRRFNQRLKNYVRREYDMSYEYISAWEYQARGSLHCHLVIIFDKKRPFLPNSKLQEIWSHGYTSTKALRDGDAVANYICSYLTDLPLEEAIPLGIPVAGDNVRVAETKDADGKKSKHYLVKAGRMGLYKPGFRLYRRSRGIKDPEVITCSAAHAMREIGDIPCIYERTVAVYPEDSDTPVNIINVRKFDKRRLINNEQA